MYFNTTYLLLAPQLSYYGVDFVQDLLSLKPVFYGIGYKRLKHRKLVVAVLNRTKVQSFFDNYKRVVIKKEETIGSNNNIVGILTIKIPDRFHSAYDNFMRGRYSKMYTTEEIDNLYTHDDRLRILNKKYYILAKDIFSRSKSLKQKIENKIGVELDNQAEVFTIYNNKSNIINE